MCNGIRSDILRFAMVWGVVPITSEVPGPSEALKQALLVHSPLSPTQIGHKMKIFPCIFTKRLCVPFYVGHKKIFF